MGNTLNICLGHKPFPKEYERHIDVMLSPFPLEVGCKFYHIEDAYFGPHGHALSEYAQLLWVFDHFDSIVGDHEYVRVFQYRRMVSKISPLPTDSPLPWYQVIPPDQLSIREAEFSRDCHEELFNGVLSNYSVMLYYTSSHVLEDLLNFGRFMMDSGMADQMSVANFLTSNQFMPACNMGVFKRETFHSILSILRAGSQFMYSKYFVPRQGYQRRCMGFLLERLNSAILIERIRTGVYPPNLGYNLVIQDDPVMTPTVDIR